MGEFEIRNLVTALIDEVNAVQLRGGIPPVDYRRVARSVGTDQNGIIRRSTTLGLEFLVPGAAALEQDRVAGIQIHARCLGQRFPRSGGAVQAGVAVIAGCTHVVGLGRRRRGDVQLDLLHARHACRLNRVGMTRGLSGRDDLGGWISC